jgi:hypothetical protein
LVTSCTLHTGIETGSQASQNWACKA